MNNRNKISSYHVLMAASMVLSAFLILLSALKIAEFRNTTTNLEKERLALEQNEQKLMEMMSLEKDRSKLANIISVLKDKLPDNPNEYQLMVQMRNMSLKHNAEFKTIKFEERINHNDMVEMPFSMIVSGKFSSIVELLADISGGERLIRVDKIKIAKLDGQNGTIQADITASAYHR